MLQVISRTAECRTRSKRPMQAGKAKVNRKAIVKATSDKGVNQSGFRTVSKDAKDYPQLAETGMGNGINMLL